VLVLGGSECRLSSTSFSAAYVTTAGYHALAVDYCSAGVISQVPLEGLMAAIDWLAVQPDVDATRLAVIGGSRGGELALEQASRPARLKAVVAVVPSVYGWSDTGSGQHTTVAPPRAAVARAARTTPPGGSSSRRLRFTLS